MPQNADGHRRQGMRLQHDVLPLHLAPGTDKALTGFDEIDGALELRAPCAFCRLVLALVHLHKTAWRQDRIHGEIFLSDVTVRVTVVRSKHRQIGERHNTPLFDHSSKVRGRLKAESWVQANGNGNLSDAFGSLRNM